MSLSDPLSGEPDARGVAEPDLPSSPDQVRAAREKFVRSIAAAAHTRDTLVIGRDEASHGRGVAAVLVDLLAGAVADRVGMPAQAESPSPS